MDHTRAKGSYYPKQGFRQIKVYWIDQPKEAIFCWRIEIFSWCQCDSLGALKMISLGRATNDDTQVRWTLKANRHFHRPKFCEQMYFSVLLFFHPSTTRSICRIAGAFLKNNVKWVVLKSIEMKAGDAPENYLSSCKVGRMVFSEFSYI